MRGTRRFRTGTAPPQMTSRRDDALTNPRADAGSAIHEQSYQFAAVRRAITMVVVCGAATAAACAPLATNFYDKSNSAPSTCISQEGYPDCRPG